MSGQSREASVKNLKLPPVWSETHCGPLLGGTSGSGIRGWGRPRVFRAINDSDAAYVALAHQKAVLELGTTSGPTRRMLHSAPESNAMKLNAETKAGVPLLNHVREIELVPRCHFLRKEQNGNTVN